MDRVLAMLLLLAILVSLVFIILAFFAVAPITCSCVLSLLYTVYVFMAYEDTQLLHQAQEYENRFWTIFALLFSTALFFAKDSPIAIGRYSGTLGFVAVIWCSYVMHLYDRHKHREEVSRDTKLRRSVSSKHALGDYQITGKEQLSKINGCLRDIDQLFIPSTINNFLNRRFVLRKEKEIINVFLECDATTLNYLVCNLKLALLVYKVKDHGFGGQHRTELIQLLAVERLPALTVMSRVIVLHALQILKLSANQRGEYWVCNILLSTHGDDLSELKTLTDAKGDYYSMSKLIYEDIRSGTVRQDILSHIRKEAAMQLSRRQLGRGSRSKHLTSWRKILSDVDDTLCSSGGMYPAGIDKRYPRKVVYPGVLAFYRELDLGTCGPEDWPEHRVGNLVFLSARPHVYKDVSEKSNFEKFEKLRVVGKDGRRGMHTVPSLLPGDISSGGQYIATNDLEPLARKKFENFERYVSIYPEYQHFLVGDNGQGDVKAGEMMFSNFPYEFHGNATYVHVVQDIQRTFGVNLQRWRENEFHPCFFRTYPEAALHASTQNPPLIRLSGLKRVCIDSVHDFYAIPEKKWHSREQKGERRTELNQAIWKANQFLCSNEIESVELILAERVWAHGEKVKTPYGNGIIRGFNPEFDLYNVELDWRPVDVQVNEFLQNLKEEAIRPKPAPAAIEKRASAPLETVVEADEVTDDEHDEYRKEMAIEPPSLASPTKNLSRSISAPIKTGEFGGSSKLGPSNVGQKNGTKQPTMHDNSKVVASSMSDSSSVSSLSSDGSNPYQKPGSPHTLSKVTASVAGSAISKFMPPALPKVSKKPTPMFSFWDTTVSQKKVVEEERCSTPYGPAIIVEHRKEQKIIVVDMVGWKARAYLKEEDVKVTREGLLSSLFRRQPSVSEPSNKLQQFPYAVGTIIPTPFGVAEVVMPLPAPESDSATSTSDDSETICLSITSWTLADGTHPKLYSTVKTCQMWKDSKELKSPTDGLFSAFGTLVSSINREIFSARRLGQKTKEEGFSQQKYTQYYSNSAAVSTAFGNGRVVSFRQSDGFYCVALSGWKLANGMHPTAHLREVDIRYQIAKGCKEGYPVLTSLGVSGVLESVQPTTGIHMIHSQSARMVLYLQPEAIVRPLKAAVGEDALTAYGEGKVERYDVEHDTYVILLGWGARIYCKAETFDRLRDSVQDKDGSFGMDWLLRFFFSSPDVRKEGTRSRSNSVVSSHTASAR